MRIRATIILVVSFFFSLPSLADERIVYYDVDLAVQVDGSVDVTERITVNVEGQRIKRGIFRDIPTRYTRHGTDVTVGLGVTSVTMDGQPVQWKVERLGAGKRIRIGSANKFLSHGQHRFIINYTTTRQLLFFEGRDELYWNVTGNGWDFAINEVTARVSLPVGAQISETTAFTGARGSTAKNYEILGNDGSNVTFKTVSLLGRGEGITIAVTWPSGVIVRPTLKDEAAQFTRDNMALVIGIIGTIFLFFYFYGVWTQFGRDNRNKVIIPQYEPPKGLAPAICRHIANMGYDATAVTSAIVSLATKGYLSIQQSSDRITLVKEDKSVKISKAEQALIGPLMSGKSQVVLGKEYSSDFVVAVANFREMLQADESHYFVKNRGSFYVGCALGVSVLGAMALSYSDTIMGIILMAFTGMTMFAFIKAMKKTVFSRSMAVLKVISTLSPIAIIIFIAMNDFAHVISIPFLAIIIVVMFMCGLFFWLLKAPTEFGRSIMDEIDGFKLYLSKAEKDRMNFHNPPEKTPELFEKYLPYAIALGVENEWGEQFDEVLSRAAASTGESGYHPLWYSGSGSRSHFNSRDFSNNISSGIASSIATATTAPSSSGGGFSGGGFSGGGGGGGGGGGW